AWRETTGARHSLSLRLSRAGPLLQLDAVLDGADGERRRSLFGEEAGRLALDMSAVVRDWLDRRPRGSGPPRDLDGEVASTFALGVDAYLRGDLDTARHYFSLCIERSPDSLQPRLHLATIELKYADVQRAADLVDEVLARVDTQRQPHFALDAQRVLGYVELQRGRLDAARAAFERARLLFRAESTPAQRAVVFDGLAQVASRSGRFAEAAEHLQQSLALYDAVDDAVGQATAWNNIGVLERMRGRTAAAETALLRALAIARAHDVPWQQSLTLANLVQLRVSQRRYREALRLGEAALIQLQPPAPRDTRAERVLLQELAVARLQLGQAGVARSYARRSLALAENGGDPAGAAMASVALAQADVALGEPDALARYRKAITDCETTGQIPRAAYHLARLAGLQRRAGDLAGLRESVAWTRRLAELAKTSDLRGYTAAAQAQLDAAEGRGEQALQHLLDARRDALRAEDRTSAQRSGLDYVVLAIELGRSDAAGALLAELDADNDTEGDALALAEIWRRARGDDAGAEALRARRDQLDAALPPPNATILGTDAGRGGEIVL
ncbi:tetratricopeptide repeat protein, partial [Tahibacter caeni]|uniref:tetratricopeptide repeat protein n=1 Tax=Tahibacter caeni TaxID=1453545 RepID=UPI0021478C37